MWNSKCDHKVAVNSYVSASKCKWSKTKYSMDPLDYYTLIIIIIIITCFYCYHNNFDCNQFQPQVYIFLLGESVCLIKNVLYMNVT